MVYNITKGQSENVEANAHLTPGQPQGSYQGELQAIKSQVTHWTLSTDPNYARVECCFTFTETVGLLGTGAQDGHLDFHIAPELCNARPWA